MTRWPLGLGAACASALLLGGVVSCGEEEAPGVLMVVVSTDLSVPADIDTLSWRVTRPDEDTPCEEGSVS